VLEKIFLLFKIETAMHKINDLKIWNKSIDLCVNVYKATSRFPKEETYGLISQMRRAAVSIPSNISEGAGRNSNGEFVQFLGIATGSAYELQTQVVISERLAFLDAEIARELSSQVDELLKMTYSFKQNIKNRTK
jgi:four helix bundle protein